MPKRAHNHIGTPVYFNCPFCKQEIAANTIRVTSTHYQKNRWVLGCKCGCRWVLEILEGPRT